MLSPDELAYVRRQGWLWDHCWRYFSLLAGESFLINDCLVHCDGAHLYLNTFPLDPKRAIDPDDLLSSLVARFEPRLIWHSGPAPCRRVDLGPALPLRHEFEPDPGDVCMVIDVCNFDLAGERKRLKWVRAGERRGLECRISSPSYFTVRHVQLISEFVERINPGPIALAFLSRLGDFARHRDAYTIEVTEQGKLVGFGVIEGWFESMDIALFSFGDREVPGVKDYLQWRVLLHAKERGKRWLNSGYSINPGVLAFKKKWDAQPINGGYFDQLWHGYEGFDAQHCHWPMRMLVAPARKALTLSTTAE
jgi:hypothetical protein